MKLRSSLFLAAISCVLLALPAWTARPRYGGTLHLEIAEAMNSIDPATASTLDPSSVRDQLASLLYSHNATSSIAAPSGPFRMLEWEAGKQATLVANDQSAGGRPFVDSIEVQMGRSAKDRLLDLELGKADLAELPAEDARRAAERGVRVSTSVPDELVALVFLAGRPLAEDARARQAIALAIDRPSIASFILQKEGDPAGGLLPQWSSGAAFLFTTAADPSSAKEQWSQIKGSPKISLGYDAGDALEQAIAERIAVNGREAGIPVVSTAVTSSPTSPVKADARLLRLRMSSPKPREALAGFVTELGSVAGISVTVPPDSASPEAIYECERAIVSSNRVVPLVWLPQVYGLSNRLRNWKAPGPGESWPLADVWLDGSMATSSPK
jgi:hypothetical protein